MRTQILSAALCLSAVLVMAIPATADAASLRLRCEQRFDPARSKISVDGRNVFPNAIYSAKVRSGGVTVTARPRVADGDEVEFDFDSNRANIRAGAKRIPARFIRNGSVRAVIFNASGNIVAGPTNVTCSRR